MRNLSWKLLFLIIACFVIVLLLSYAFNPKVFLSPPLSDDESLYNFCGICSTFQCWHAINDSGNTCYGAGNYCVDQGRWCFNSAHNAGRKCKCQNLGEGVAGIKFADE